MNTTEHAIDNRLLRFLVRRAAPAALWLVLAAVVLASLRMETAASVSLGIAFVVALAVAVGTIVDTIGVVNRS